MRFLIPLCIGLLVGTVGCGSDEGECAGCGNAGGAGGFVKDAGQEATAGGTGGTGATGGTGGTISTDSGPPPFPIGNVYVVGWNDRKVFEYDATLAPVKSWTDPSFQLPAPEGPAGMVFDQKGYLVVSTWDQFCVFKEPGVLDTCHPKTKPQRTENVIFDLEGTLYTTTSTGGTDEIHKYGQGYAYLTTFSLPTGQLTGITCDPSGNLYVASQISASVSKVYKVDKDALSVLDSFDVPGNAEGLQFASDGNLLVALSAGVGIVRVIPSTPSSVLGTIANPGLLWPVPLTVDQGGLIYTGDFEDGNGNAPADLFVFDSTGAITSSAQPSELHGPFGLVVAGTVLPCGAFQQPR
jgi:sugar lactone lactonase YvrE